MSDPLICVLHARSFSDLHPSKQILDFVQLVRKRYTEGTLARLLDHQSARVQMAALLALRYLGSMASNTRLAKFLRCSARKRARLAEEALWSIWFRGERNEDGNCLERLAFMINEGDWDQALKGLNRLIETVPSFAEAYNQRAILFWRRSEYDCSIEDCLTVLKLNPYHFGAQAGLGQCYLESAQPELALVAFRKARRLNPHLLGVDESIEALENYLGEEA